MKNRNSRNYSMLCDEYEFAMSNAYLLENKENEVAVFDAFFRKVPNNGGYAVMAGIDKIIDYINNLHFNDEDLEYFRNKGYSEKFIEYMKNFKFTGSIYAIPDGTPVFPNEPLITVKAPIVQAQIVETALLTMLNGSMEHATGARRIVESTPENVAIMEFGARRADGTEAAIDSSIYAIMAGCKGTSNVQVAKMLGIKAMGTMAHSYIESFDSELEAFISFAKAYPTNAILLVDTYDTLKSGMINAIKTFQYMKDEGMDLSNIGIRIDSGDLAYLSKEARKMLDESGFPQAKICLSNGLDAQTIESLINQGAKFNSLGVGDNISKPDGRMGAVYKEVALITKEREIPKIKISGDIIKVVNPGYKKLYRVFDKNTGYALGDVMSLHNEKIDKNELKIVSLTDNTKYSTFNNFELKELQVPIFENGIQVYEDPSILEKAKYCKTEFEKIYPEIKRILNPHGYYVDGTVEYANFKNDMIMNVKKKVKEM